MAPLRSWNNELLGMHGYLQGIHRPYSATTAWTILQLK